VPAGEVNGSTPVNVDGFNMCGTTYRFFFAPITSDGRTGPRSGNINVGALNQGSYRTSCIGVGSREGSEGKCRSTPLFNIVKAGFIYAKWVWSFLMGVASPFSPIFFI
jgi:hypothetical protein